ncbi:MAG TPA: preprotein translocase subunit SecA, partial [Bacteroidales bacterium]|nr:preprotein translocase subunit SecA [Bacteroidales bacterium]
MGFVEVLSKLFGNKSQRDLREIMPYVDKVKAVYPEIRSLDNDALRERTEQLKKRLADAVAADKQRIAELKASVEQIEIEKREKVYREVDKLEKDIADTYEKVLLEILPEAFAIVKDTARRFAENETIEVTATDFDRNLAATRDFVHIDGDKAVYQNHWMAGGNEITWDMVHYDVQL